MFIKTITLDDIIADNFLDHIDFLKIDTEGSELMILDGLSNSNLDKIRCIAIEYHHSIFNSDENVYSNFQNRFLGRGFNVFTWILDGYTRMMYICKGDVFTLNVIPHTIENTTLKERVCGDKVNIEVDVMAKYAEKISAKKTEKKELTKEFLNENGYTV